MYLRILIPSIILPRFKKKKIMEFEGSGIFNVPNPKNLNYSQIFRVVVLIKYAKNLSNYFLKFSPKFLNHYYQDQLTLTGGEKRNIFNKKI